MDVCNFLKCDFGLTSDGVIINWTNNDNITIVPRDVKIDSY